MPPYPSPVSTWRTSSYAAISPLLSHLSTVGKNIVITGGGSGIGAAIAHSFAASGASTISLLGRRESAISHTEKVLSERFPSTKFSTHRADITSITSLSQAFSEIKSRVGTVDILIANAGHSPPRKSIQDSDFEDWSAAFDINVKGNVNLIKYFLPLAGESAAVLNITAGAVHVPYLPGFGAYATSKLAAAKIFEYLHHERPDLFVLNIHPGLIDTGISGNPNKLQFDDISLPADFAVWAVSPEARFLNGRLVWANWDASELKALSDEIERSKKFTIGLNGWP